MSDESPWTDDRAEQDTLFDLSAEEQASRDRETRTDAGASDAFADDRNDPGQAAPDSGKQAGLFEQTEEMEGQAALGGGTASQTEDGFFGGGNGGGGGNGPPAGALETAMDTFAAETPNKTSDLRREVDPGDLGSRLSGDPTPLLQTVTDRRVARGAARPEDFREIAREAGGEGRVGEIETAFVGFTEDQFGGAGDGVTDTDQSDPFAFDDYGATSREPVPEAERQEMEQFGGRDKRSLAGTGLAPSDPRIARQTERQSRRDRNEPPDDLAEQLAAQRAMPSLVRPSATPAVQLSDSERETASDGKSRNGDSDVIIGSDGFMKGTISPSFGGFSETERGSGKLVANDGREVLISENRQGANNRRKSFSVTLREEGAGLGEAAASERISFGEYADRDVDEAAAGVENLVNRFGAGVRLEPALGENTGAINPLVEPSAEPPVSLFGPRSGGEQPETAPTGAEPLEDPDLIRLKSSGRFNRDPTVNEPAAPGQRALANGHLVGDSDNITRPADPGAPIMRDPDTGQFVVSDR